MLEPKGTNGTDFCAGGGGGDAAMTGAEGSCRIRQPADRSADQGAVDPGMGEGSWRHQ